MIFKSFDFERFATSFMGGTVDHQWEASVAKVSGKIFALMRETPGNPPVVIFKCESDAFEILCSLPGVQQAPYFARGQWVAIERGAPISDEELRQYVVKSYNLVVGKLPKRTQAAIGAAT